MEIAGFKSWRGPVQRFPFNLWMRIRDDIGTRSPVANRVTSLGEARSVIDEFKL